MRPEPYTTGKEPSIDVTTATVTEAIKALLQQHNKNKFKVQQKNYKHTDRISAVNAILLSILEKEICYYVTTEV